MKNIRNIPEWAKGKKYLVIRPWGNEWDEGEERDANTQAWEVNGEVITQ